MHAVRTLDADIVSLQEVDERSRRPGDPASFVTLREAFDRYSAEARTIRSPDGDYGHVLMSCWPMRDNEYLDLSFRRREPRIAISCMVDTAAIIMGDFNEWRRSGIATRTLCPPFEVAAGLASFPSRRPMFPLDRIWSRAPLEPLRASVALEYRDLSDHLGVLADLRFSRDRA